MKLEAGVRKARLEVLERLASAMSEPMWRLFADSRLTVAEEKWRSEVGKLAEIAAKLSKG